MNSPKPLSKRRFRKRWLTLFAVSVLTGGLLLQQWSAQKPLPEMTTVQRGDIESSVLASGTLRPKNLVAIGAQATGRILSLKVKPGQHVKEGDVIALIDATNQQNELDKAEATLRQNEATREQNLADLELAKLNLARNQMMIGKNAVARSEYDKAVAETKKQQAQLANTEASIAASKVGVRIAETNLAYTRITAPIDGTILSTVAQEGQNVNAQQTVPTIAILGQVDTMTVEADISEADITQVHDGLPIYFTISGRNAKRYDAKLEAIEPAPDSVVSDKSFGFSSGLSASSSVTASAVYYKGKFSIPNANGLLRTYMTAEIHIVLAKVKNVLLSPVSALKLQGDTDPDAPGVATVRVLTEHGTLEERTVETGITDKINTEVRSGLQEGDKIVTDNQDAKETDAGD
ncbi:macrolide-specific efflux system membrane fusion protein [Ochrobactrum sp. 19YEA23]|uniref:efflux RND transporter periplasmic adaptor subunit n=1 Tax=Ochrobactrum sp. 19YEA23 TaxID=3039854 RepID=UPI0024783F3A|nr:macrolide-specific efflux system membrane fusion protein [Ochrobactrum sp. 19YEA23]